MSPHDLHDHHHTDADDGLQHDQDGREAADAQLWQFREVRVEVAADRFVGVTPFLPEGIQVEATSEGFVIHGTYGFDLFSSHRFVILLDGELQTFTRLADIPAAIDGVVGFYPDDTHDITLTYTFEKAGVTFTHTHWIHHDMEPWEAVLQELLTRETNGGWNARRDALRRRRHTPLLRHDADDGEPQRLRQRDPRLAAR